VSVVLQSLLSAGILAVLLTQLATTLREWWSKKEERKGLLRILFAEVYKNQGFLGFFIDVHRGGMQEEDKQKAYKRHLEDEDVYLEAWRDTRLQLAQLLSSGEFAILASYYEQLDSLKDPPPKVGDTTPVLELRPDVGRHLFRRGQKVEGIIRLYVPDVATDMVTITEILEEAQSGQ
jgi:hypothetical protein